MMGYILINSQSLGVTADSNFDVFFEKKSPNYLDPPSPLTFGKFIALCSRKFVDLQKFAMKFFGFKMTPPPFWTFFPKFMAKIYRFETKKSAKHWIGHDPPPLGPFSKKHPNLRRQSPLNLRVALSQIEGKI